MESDTDTAAPHDAFPQGAVLPFYLTGEEAGATAPLVRGRLARLFAPCQSILRRHDYPDSVAELCAEAMALAACLSTTLKFDGVFTMQAKGDGAVKTLFADVTSKGHLRSYAAFDAEAVARHDIGQPSVVPRLMGGGYMAFTVDQNPALGDKGHRYQGIVELEGMYLGDCAISWFRNSEQLAAQTITAAVKTNQGWQAAALFVQQIAGEGGALAGLSADSLAAHWHTVMVMMGSVTRDELLAPGLSSAQLLYRLFHAHGLHLQPARPVRDKCRCSDQKVEQMLASLSPEQLSELCDDDGSLSVDCEFCKASRFYHLDDVISTAG